MTRGIAATGMLMAFAVDAASPESTDLMRYAITQGGLLAVVLVLLWSYRKDTLSVLHEQEDRLKVLTDLVTQSTGALMKSADASERMARAVENLNRRP